MRPTLVTFGALLLLWTIVSQLNHALTGWHVYLWVGGLFVTHAALDLPLRSGLAASFLIGLLFDATAPVYFGTHALLFAVAHSLVFNVRDRVPRDETAARVVVALFANLALFLVFAIHQSGRLPVPAAVWPRLIFDLVCSQVLVALVAPWFFAFQTRLLELTHSVTPDFERPYR